MKLVNRGIERLYEHPFYYLECQFGNNTALDHDILPCSCNGTTMKIRRRVGICGRKFKANESENIYEPCRYEQCIQKQISEPIYMNHSAVHESIIGLLYTLWQYCETYSSY